MAGEFHAHAQELTRRIQLPDEVLGELADARSEEMRLVLVRFQLNLDGVRGAGENFTV